ncbi:Uncharacterised protein [Bordetella pertussis]|nr:Uncharacterised protein [Bordetella pertussis]CPH71830.1 Uncharacterised protein [Bordetella pertussis]CPL72369.1 Uncharacterised protein [Bordetella pertussis]
MVWMSLAQRSASSFKKRAIRTRSQRCPLFRGDISSQYRCSTCATDFGVIPPTAMVASSVSRAAAHSWASRFVGNVLLSRTPALFISARHVSPRLRYVPILYSPLA